MTKYLKYFKNKKNLIIIVLVIVLLTVAFFIFKAFRQTEIVSTTKFNPKTFKGLVIDDVIKIPDTTNIAANAGEIIPRGEYNVKLQPISEQESVHITKAKLTLKEAYTAVKTTADNWALDSKLAFIKSNGALGLDGMSSSWQIVFGSTLKQKTLEIILEGDKVISQKEINSNLDGYDLPINWYDSNEAIASLSNLPQFSADTLSSISFYYSGTAKSWAYGLATGQKTTSMWVK